MRGFASHVTAPLGPLLGAIDGDRIDVFDVFDFDIALFLMFLMLILLMVCFVLLTQET